MAKENKVLHRACVKEALEGEQKDLYLIAMPANTDGARWRVLVLMSPPIGLRDITMDLSFALDFHYDHMRQAIKSVPFCFNGQDIAEEFNRVFGYTPKIFKL